MTTSLPTALAATALALFTPGPRPIQEEAPSSPTAVEVNAEVRAFLADLGRGFEERELFAASYVQTRRSELLFEPLVSRGRLLHRAEPATLVFEVTEPRVTKIWVQDGLYQVHRPAEGRAERFVFEERGLWRSLLACFSADAPSLAKLFEPGAVVRGDGVRRLDLTPRDDTMRTYVSSMTLRLREEDDALVGLIYVDGSGDEIELAIDPEEGPVELEDPDAFFSIDLPAEVQLEIEHVKARRRDG